MHHTNLVGILETEMDEDEVIEIEIQQELDRLHLESDELATIDLNDNGHEDDKNDTLSSYSNSGEIVEQDIPEELLNYIHLMQKQRLVFENELAECDSLLTGKLNIITKPEENLVPYDDWKELEEAARQEGLSVEEYKQKLLQEIENDSFELEEIPVYDDSTYSSQCKEDILLIEDSKDNNLVNSNPDLTVSSSDHGSNINLPIKDDCYVANKLAVVHTNPLAEFGYFLKEQMQLTEESFKRREFNLKQELESQRALAEKMMLLTEEQQFHIQQTLAKEEQILAARKQEMNAKLEQEIEDQQKILELELKRHEEEISLLTEQLEEDRYCLEVSRKAAEERHKQAFNLAAICIQRYYRGYRIRHLHQSECRIMLEKREQRKLYKEEQRIAEVEREIQEKKEKQRRIEEERLKKEEAERIQKEEEERKRKEEKRKMKEEEDRKRKEVERKLKEEEDRKRKAEEEQRKEELRKQREKEEKIMEQKRQEEEERKNKEEEEKKRKEEEEKKEREEERKRKEEKEKEKKRREEERKKKEDEEKEIKRREEEKRKQIEEKIKYEEEQAEEKRKKEEDQRRKENENKHKEKEEEIQKEEERKFAEFKETEKIEEERKMQEKEMQLTTEKNEDEKIEKRKNYEEKKVHTIKEGLKNETEIKPLENIPESIECVVIPQQPRPVDNLTGSGISVECYEPSSLYATSHPVISNTLPHVLETRRLEWMKTCIPWSKVSNEPWKLKSRSKTVPRRPSSAKKLPPLPEDVVLTGAHASTLKQVTTVELHDLPAYSLSTLSICLNLKHLKLTHCGLKALENLSQCRHLQCVDVQENFIEYLDLKDLSSLHVLNLSHNKLTTLHGMSGCSNLRWLDISYNRLTQLGDLAPLHRLHTLLASNNQLVSTSGLEQCPSIQHLDVSVNYLTTIQGLGNLGLLIVLDASSNSLTEVPKLQNQVLLQMLSLRENSIGPLVDLSDAWLPLLSYLDLSQNIIENLSCSNGGLLILKRLDLAVNQIIESPSFLSAVSNCKRLEDLSLQGNAVVDEENLRDKIKDVIPSLLCLNGETLRLPTKNSQSSDCLTSFEVMCLSQIQMHGSLRCTLDKECRARCDAPNDKSHICESYFKFCEHSFKLSLEHRYAHEYGELSTSKVPSPPFTPRTSQQLSSRACKPSPYFGTTCDEEKSLLPESVSPYNLQHCIESEQSSSFATQVPLSEKDKFELTLKNSALLTEKANNQMPENVQTHCTDIVTISGSPVRDSQTAVIASQKSPLSDVLMEDENLDDLEQLMDGLHFDIDGFLELEQFEFDELLHEKGWRPEDSPQFPIKLTSGNQSSSAVITKPPLPPVPQLHFGHTHSPAPFPGMPVQAWHHVDSPMTEKSLPRPPSSVLSGEDSQAMPTGRSKREEKIAQDWGFKDNRTAEMMLSRAKKMKYNAERRKKLSKLDPQQRLKLFRKMEAVSQMHSVRPPPARVLPRKEYFQARQEEVQQKEFEKQMEFRTRVGRTFEWIHTQVGDHDVSSSRINSRPVGGEGHLLKTASDTQLSQQHDFSISESPVNLELETTSNASGSRSYWSHRHSLTGHELTLTGSNLLDFGNSMLNSMFGTIGQTTSLPPIKTGSAPSHHSAEREKLSWRSEQVDKSIGWGGGKKRVLKK